MLVIELKREHMPGLQRDSVRSLESEWGCFVAQEAPLLRHSDVLKPGKSHPVQVKDLILKKKWDSEDSEENTISNNKNTKNVNRRV